MCAFVFFRGDSLCPAYLLSYSSTRTGTHFPLRKYKIKAPHVAVTEISGVESPILRVLCGAFAQRTIATLTAFTRT